MVDDSDSYMRHAEGDLATAEKSDGDDESDICARAFHAQQAAEKAIKAVLVASGKKPRWTHDLAELASELPVGYYAGASDFDLSLLTEYAATSRYGSIRLSKTDADTALSTAKDVMQAMRTCLGNYSSD